MPLTEASLAVWLFAFARLVGWTLFDPLTGRLPLSLRVFIARCWRRCWRRACR